MSEENLENVENVQNAGEYSASKITVLTMGPQRAADILREALFRVSSA
jgi:electron transfer flavoprotein alpha/beta subunit